MKDPIAPFLGTWILDVDGSSFEQGTPPRAGSCSIEADGLKITFHMLQLDAEGETGEASFSGVPDGRPVSLGESGLADTLVLYLTPDGELVSEARRGGAALMSAARAVSQDGATMTIRQTVHLPDGTSATDTAVYRRAQ